MNGLMQRQPLLISSLLRHAERHHGEQLVVSRRVEGDIHRTTYRELAARSRKLARALAALGVMHGDRVGTIAWNGYRHLELYYAVSGSGAVLHTLNPRLHADQVVWIGDHAEDKVLCFDKTFLPLVESRRLAAGHRQALRADGRPQPTCRRPPPSPTCCATRTWSTAQPDDFEWPVFDEETASSLCYTSGTTGNPKGVLYSHRSTVLHTYASALPDALNLSARDVVLPVVPMFHVNAWGLPYSACMVGARLVLPGPGLDGASLYELFESEQVTLSAGVPTVWQGLLTHVQAKGLEFSTMRRTIIGGSACPPAMMETLRGALRRAGDPCLGHDRAEPGGHRVRAEGGAGAVAGRATSGAAGAQGRAVFGIDMKIVDGNGAELPWDGKAAGELMVRGPWVVREYMKGESSPLEDGWFPTGDVATIDADGFMQITDRSKDVIKSGGEWIGSIDLENIAMAHPAVAKAACIAARHPKWDERPLLIVVKKPGAEVTRDELLQFYEGRIAKWWTPDDVVFVDAIPLGATGKVLKNVLRTQFQDHLITAK